MTHTLSPEQKVVSRALLSGTSSDIKYFDLSTAFLPFYKVLITLLSENKNALIHIPRDSEVATDILGLIEHYKLDNFVIDIGNKNPIPETDILKLRTLLKKDVDTAPIINHLLKTQQLKSKQTTTEKYYSALDRKVHTDRTFRDFATSLISRNEIKTSKINITDLEIRLDLSGQEYYSIKRSINNAVELYTKEFDLLDQLDIISKDVWSISEDEFLSTRVTLHTLNQTGKELLKKYKRTFYELQEDTAEDVRKQIDDLIIAIEHHHHLCIVTNINDVYKKNEKSGSFSIFGKKPTKPHNTVYIDAFDEISGMINRISKEWYDELPAPTSEEIDYPFIERFLSECKSKAPVHTDRIRQNLLKSIHRINRINTSSEDVKMLDAELTQLIEKLNEIKFVQQKFNSNSMSFIKQMKMCQKISSSLDQCQNLVGKDTPYTKWKRAETTNSQLANVLINELKSIPKSEWLTQFDLWYNQQIPAITLSGNSIEKSSITDLLELNREITNTEVISLINKRLSNRLDSAVKLKASFKDIYNTLFKKKTPPNVSWNQLMHTTGLFLQEFFPVHICDTIENTSNYDTVFSFSHRSDDHPSDECVHYISPILQKDIDDMSTSNDHFLYLNTYQYNVPITELPTSEKLKASKKLAKFILSLNQQIKIYQLKTGNIISLLPPSDDNQLERRLDKYGIKSIDVTDALYEKLTESILFTERQPYLIIKDELINPEMHQHLMWQAEIIQIFRTAGYKVLSLNTDRQLENNERAIEEIIHTLVDKSHQPAQQETQTAIEDTSNSIIV